MPRTRSSARVRAVVHVCARTCMCFEVGSTALLSVTREGSD